MSDDPVETVETVEVENVSESEPSDPVAADPVAVDPVVDPPRRQRRGRRPRYVEPELSGSPDDPEHVDRPPRRFRSSCIVDNREALRSAVTRECEPEEWRAAPGC